MSWHAVLQGHSHSSHPYRSPVLGAPCHQPATVSLSECLPDVELASQREF